MSDTHQEANGNVQANPTQLTTVDEIFKEKSAEILAAMTEVLLGFGIEGYTVHAFTISQPPRPNPDVCIPSLTRKHDHVYELQCTYVELDIF